MSVWRTSAAESWVFVNRALQPEEALHGRPDRGSENSERGLCRRRRGVVSIYCWAIVGRVPLLRDSLGGLRADGVPGWRRAVLLFRAAARCGVRVHDANRRPTTSSAPATATRESVVGRPSLSPADGGAACGFGVRAAFPTLESLRT